MLAGGSIRSRWEIIMFMLHASVVHKTTTFSPFLFLARAAPDDPILHGHTNPIDDAVRCAS
jgi:hypothetical protein